MTNDVRQVVEQAQTIAQRVLAGHYKFGDRGLREMVQTLANGVLAPPAPSGCSNGAHLFFQPEKHPVCRCGAWKMRDVAGMPIDGVPPDPQPAPSDDELFRAREWRDIESAPVDGTPFLVLMPQPHQWSRMHVAVYHPNVRVVGGLFAFDLPSQPTHWMPLPPAPAQEPTS